MPEGRKKVIIGGEYRETYANMVKILRSGYLDSAGARVEKGMDGAYVICTDNAEYVYDESAELSAGSAAVTINKDGASWFAPVRRGMAFDDGTSEWKQLIYKVASDFHSAFSIIEYKRCDGSGNTDAKQVEANLNKIIRRFFKRGDAQVIKGNDINKGSEDIYGASVKLELSGTGQSHYVVMCKIFFRRTSDGISPLAASEAAQINARLEEAPDNTDPVRLSDDEAANINNVTVNAVRELVNGKFAVGFKESLCFSTRQVLNPETKEFEDNYDLKTYKHLASRAHANAAAVTCNSVQVLGISHVEWLNDYYEVAFGGRVYLQAVIGFGGSITLRCVNCGGGNLITSNVITYTVTDDDGLSRRVNVTLDYGADDLGVNDEALAEINKYGEFAKHLLSVSCSNARLGKKCSACVCKSQTIAVDGEAKCADCPYPEVVYTDYSGELPVRYLTGKMTFVHDRLAMALKENAGECKRCGRAFLKDALTGGQCKLCAGIENLGAAESEQAKRLYSKYKNAFSHSVRLKHLFDNKYCVEDDTALVFALGGDTYIIKKSDLSEDKGFIKQPVRVN
ncbi:MAG: hypothetical protein NC033_02475 [Clostridiales bacterium]|nr:hypothetical protein [Clostridiales bacterium]